MPKITFMGAGSMVFAKSVLGDAMLSPALHDAHIALYDIDALRLKQSEMVLGVLNRNINAGRATITAHLGPAGRKSALRGAHYVINAIQVGGYKPGTMIDFEVPKRYGLRQTIGDTIGIGGIFRALRTIPVLLDFARDMEAVCPDAWFLNYTNPMAMNTAALLRGTSIRAVGLCHSVQSCARTLVDQLGIEARRLNWKIAGINHQAWLLEIRDGKRDLYPAVRQRAAAILEMAAAQPAFKHRDLVRLYLMMQLGYYITESSEHNAEYMPYFIKSQYPDLIRRFNIPLDEYPARCRESLRLWKRQRREFTENPRLGHQRSQEYGAVIMEAMETDVPVRIGGNVMNRGLITNLPSKACVEVSCLVDANGVQGTHVGDLPEACAALNRNCINPQILATDAALTRRKEYIYQAAMLDPHTAAELPIDLIRALCDDLIAAHGSMLPRYHETVVKPLHAAATAAHVGAFHVIGPFDNRAPDGTSLGLAQVLPPERGVDLKAVYRGLKRRRLAWKKITREDADPSGFVDLGRICGKAVNAVGYAWTVLKTSRAQRVKLLAGSDDGLAVWLNGRRVLRVEAARAAAPAQNSVRLALRKGRNELLIKVDQKSGLWGFYAQLDGAEGRVSVEPG